MNGNKKVIILVLVVCFLIMCVGCTSNTAESNVVAEEQTKVNTDVFHFSADEFIYQLSSKYVVGDYELLGSPKTLDNGDFICAIISPEDMVGAVSFIDNGNFVTDTQTTQHTITGILAYIFLDVADADLAGEIMLGLVGVCDPSLDSLGVLTVCSEITDATEQNEKYEHNGIRYSLVSMGDYLLFSATLVDQNS